ncbi:unnamed protein product [Linum tenue]|uniref:NB-ARC domain-containing protein n=1 Tax=Linum tenue TaxID=586396 RepID=A0AAV0NSS6_9ROSI|nr:unnamed protein product [Linum tenue]
MGGVGKTTLAQIVYNDNVEVTGRKCFSTTLNQLQVMLKEKLNGKKFLLVLDDVWNDKYAHWDILLRPLKSGTEGSKVVVTTRHETVASVMGTVVAYHLRELSDDDCWCLFLKHVFEVRKCRGLPLAAKTLAGLLRAKTDVAEWERVLKSDMWDLSNEDILPALRLSYHYLPSHLKQCFAYCALFPKEELEICNCPKLRSLPDEGLPFSLSSLSVFLCPLLEHRCQPYTGEDWPKICHIPHIEISFFQISCQS